MGGTVVIACAGSGKTTRLIEHAATAGESRILITTYTNENTDHIRECLIGKFGCIPANITVQTWYSVLLAHGVRPYHNLVAKIDLPSPLNMVDLPEEVRRRFAREKNVEGFYFTSGGHMYRDRVSDFICLVNQRTGGRVIRRLERIFDWVLIDELQDMSGHDPDLIELILRSKIQFIGVADPRQSTFSTTRSRKNRGEVGDKITEWLKRLEKRGLLKTETLATSRRSNQIICDWADKLYPHLPGTVSLQKETTGHDGVFTITPEQVPAYVEAHNPVILRWNKAADTLGLPAINIGLSKGRTYDRVLIFPTAKMKSYLETGDLAKAGDLPKFYVAITRARYSVAFVVAKRQPRQFALGS